MKKVTLLCLFMFCVASLSQAQKQYDELSFPELNDFQKPEVETFTADNGITYFLVEDTELPLIDVNVRIRTGDVLVPNEKAGLASITGTALRSGGTENYPADSLNELLENRAASMESSIGFSSGTASMNVLKEDFDRLLPVFVDLLANPAFPEDKVELAKTQQKSSISRRNDNTQQIGFREFDRLIYGQNSTYGRNVEYETINNISREDLVAFHDQHFSSENLMVGVVGDFDASEMKEKLQQEFGSFPTGSETALDFPEVDYKSGSSINFIEKSDVNQSFVLMGHLGGLRDNPDYAKVQVMNQVLSGGFSGRLMQKVRTEMGLAYSVFGQYGMSSFYPGVFYTGVMTKSSTTAEAIDAIIEQVELLQQEPITEEELQDVKDQILNSSVFEYDSYEQVLAQQMSYAYRDLPSDAFDQYIEGVKSTTIEDVQEVAQKYLEPNNLQILVVGNKEEIGDQLQKYGEVNEIDISIPQPGDNNKEVVEGDAEKGQQLLDQMTNALIEEDVNLNSLSLESEVVQYNEQLPGGSMTIQSQSTIIYPDAIEQTMNTPQGTINMELKDGEGVMKMGGQERPLPPQMAQSLRETLNRDFLAVALNRSNLDPQYISMEEFEGEQYAKVSVNINDKDIAFLLNPDTGLPRLMRYQQFNPQAGEQVQVEERFSDWQTNDGVTYAYSQISFVDGKKQAETTSKSHEVNE